MDNQTSGSIELKNGSIELKNGSIFVWMVGSGDGEIFGHLQTATGEIIRGTSGWYRTNVPATAAKFVEKNLIS